MAATHLFRAIISKTIEIVVPNFCQSWDGYFLFFIFRIEMIKPAKAMIIINSSYVLIITTPSVRPPEQMEAAPPSCLGKYTIFQYF